MLLCRHPEVPPHAFKAEDPEQARGREVLVGDGGIDDAASKVEAIGHDGGPGVPEQVPSKGVDGANRLVGPLGPLFRARKHGRDSHKSWP